MSEKVLPLKVDRILVAIDGSADSEKAGLTAVDLAERYSAQIFILHVSNYPQDTLGFGSTHTVAVGLPQPDPEVDKEGKRAQEMMDRIEKIAANRGVTATSEIIEDASSRISDTILDYGYREDVDLIVTGSRGLNAYLRSTMGSVSTGVVNRARCSVLVVK